MPAFYLVIILAIVAFWFLSASIFKPLGKYFYEIFKDVQNAIKNENEGEKKNENE